MLAIKNLTEREREVFALIKKDQRIDRKTIADKLDISESAVGTYIHHLSTKGHLLGRGYIIAPEKKIVVIGGANFDIKGYSSSYIKGSSSPGWIKESTGGVARNIAENLALLEQDVVLLTAVSSDHFGEQLKAETKAVGVDISHFKIISEQQNKTGVYLAHLDQNGNLIGAVNDMKILKEINNNYLNQKRKIIEKSSMVIFDTNLAESAISFLLKLVKDKKMPIIADAVSVEKAVKLKDKLVHLDYLRANLDEAEVLVGLVKIEDSEAVQNIDLQTRIKKIEEFYSENEYLPEMIISAGKNGVFHFSRGGNGAKLKHFKAELVSNEEIVETTGAGDALTAGFAAAIMNENSVEEAIKLGMKASLLTIKSELTCNPDLSQLS